MKTILVTGGCGYLGTQLIRDLGQNPIFEGAVIRVLDNMQSGNYQALMNLPASGEYQFIEGDILDPAAVSLALQDVDTVLHLAAVVRTPMSFDNPTWVEQVNHWGTSRLIEACLEAGVTRFIYASSTAVYGPGGPFTEKDICRPFGAYAQSKFRGELQVMGAAERGLQPVILRLGTIFGLGPVMRFDAVANRFAYLAGTGRSLMVFGQGDQIRPFVHLRDASAAVQYFLAAIEENAGQVLNIVGQNISVLGLVQAVQMARPDVLVRYTAQDVLTHLSIEAESGKASSLGWSAKTSVETGLKEVLAQFTCLRPAIPQLPNGS